MLFPPSITPAKLVNSNSEYFEAKNAGREVNWDNNDRVVLGLAGSRS